MHDRIERLLSGLLTLSAAAIAVAFMHREFHAAPKPAATVAQSPEYIPSWQGLTTTGILVGDSAARVKVIEFSDFECPYCRKADSVYRLVKSQFGNDVALVFVHFPLRMHRFAMPAARAAECADEQGRFGAFHDVVFNKQDSLGLKSWGSFARDAGIVDTTRLVRCASGSSPLPRIEAGLALARRMGVHSTPVVIINGWRFFAPPKESEYTATIRTLLAGKQPYPTKPARGE